jgi:hypothetical protein
MFPGHPGPALVGTQSSFDSPLNFFLARLVINAQFQIMVMRGTHFATVTGLYLLSPDYQWNFNLR